MRLGVLENCPAYSFLVLFLVYEDEETQESVGDGTNNEMHVMIQKPGDLGTCVWCQDTSMKGLGLLYDDAIKKIFLCHHNLYRLPTGL